MSTPGTTQPAAAVPPAHEIDLWHHGEEHLATALGRLVQEDFAGPSLLPGWDRAHVLAHLAGNADAMVNLLTWARTGVETPMYPSPEARDALIEEAAALPPDDLHDRVLTGVVRLDDAVRAMDDAAWAATVRTRKGKEIPAARVPWMRATEVWVHAVDLDAGIGFADLPDDVLTPLVDEVLGSFAARGASPDVVLFAGDREWGSGSLAVAGSTAAVVAWLTGRSTGADLQADGPLPELPPWL